MIDTNPALALHQLVARFANSFDLKEWDSLKNCLADSVYTDYSDLRGTSPETMSSERFVDLRRTALQELRTHHLAGNMEIDVTQESGSMRVSMAIYRRDQFGQTLNTHCLYFFGVARTADGWRINSIEQKVLISDGQTGIHTGIAKR